MDHAIDIASRVDDGDEGSAPAGAGKARRAAAAPLRLDLEVTDPEVLAELRKLAEGPDRDRFALSALRLGVLSLRLASGQLDVAAIRSAGDELLAQVRELLNVRASALTGDIAKSLSNYFDPKSGAVPQRLEALVREGGELDRLLAGHLAGEDSVLARSLASHLGEGSPIFRMLSPTDATGLKSQVEKVLAAALGEQRTQIVKEFSLDRPESALSRLVLEMKQRQGELSTDLKGQVELVVKEFSLDKPDSALSRLVSRVEAAQKQISAQFSADDEQSALSRLSRLLTDTREQIDKNLTLDDEGSALFRLRRELVGSIEDMVKKNVAFQAEVRETLAKLDARREEVARSAAHGATFEDALGGLLASEAQRLGDVFEAVGDVPGQIPRNKTGDHVVTLGPDSAAPGACVVFEAKESASCTLKNALAEADEARKNRRAQVCVFVFSAKTAPEGLAPFARYGSDVVVVWNAEDPASDVYPKAALSLARALAVREQAASEESAAALRGLESSTRMIEKQLSVLGEVETMARTVQGHGEKIAKKAEKAKGELADEVRRLDGQLAALKAASAGPGGSGAASA